MNQDSINRLINLIVQKTDQITEQLDEILLKKFPSKSPEKLKTAIEKICYAFRDNALKKGRELPVTENMQNELKMMLYYMANIANDIRYIEGASIERTPWNLIQPLEKLAKKIDESIPIILCPEWEYNFHIISNIMNGYKQSIESLLSEEQIGEIFGESLEEIYVISFPGFEKSNILVQSILGHELGHPLATKFLNAEDEIYLSEIRDEVDRTTTETDPFQREIDISRVVQYIKIVRKRGLSEIIADLIAVRLFGFAAIFAVYDFAIMFPLDDKPELKYYYPPWRYRLREMLAELGWEGIKGNMLEISKKNAEFNAIYNEVSATIENLQEIVNDKMDIDKINSDPKLKIAYDSISKALPNIKAFLGDRLQLPNITESIEDIFYLCQRITCELPPNAIEIASPFDDSRII